MAIGFTTPIFNSLVTCEYVEEYSIDSTYKTNRVGVELFGAIANIDGVGYPLGYLLFGKTAGISEEAEENAKAITLRDWFAKMKELGFNPKFFFSDKDSATMQAIRVIFGPLCYASFGEQETFLAKISQS